MDDLLGKRRAKQPLELPSAGSTFRRPVGNYASFLIDQCGLKGASVGDAQVSKKHAGFVVNTERPPATMCWSCDCVGADGSERPLPAGTGTGDLGDPSV